MTVRHRFVSGLKWSALGKALSQIVSWAITIVVIRLLAPSDYGLMAMAMMVITLLTHVNEFGLGSALVQAKEIDDEQCVAIFGLMLLLGSSLTTALALVSPALGWFFDEPRLPLVLSVAGLGFLVSALATVPESMLRREMNFKALAGADTLGVTCGSLLTLALAWNSYGVWSLVIGNLVGTLIRMLSLHVLCPRKVLPNLRLSQCRSYLGFGGYLTASRFAWWFMSQADILIGAKLLGKEALGLYSVALNLASLPMLKTMAVINQVAFSAVAKIQEQKDAARKGLLEGFRWLGYVAFPTLGGMAVTAPEFVPIILGPNWSGAILPLQLIAMAIPLRMIGAILSMSTTAMGRADMDFRNTLTGTVVMPISFIIGAQWGPVGLAAAWLVGIPIVFLLNFPRNALATGITANDLLTVFKLPLIASLSMVGCVYLSREFLIGYIQGLPLLLVIILVGMAIYSFILVATDRIIRDWIIRLLIAKNILRGNPL